MITYKAERAGMIVELVNEKYTSQICPRCGMRNKADGRNYRCEKCGFEYHRDGVGAINIRSRTLYREITPVVGVMTPPVGIRYYANPTRTSAAPVA
ncbi:MAG: transposase [Oscillospiraceae bacterium]|jgi:putative transposase|nr:transposase [Oscillospiraceae bacterium]